jgi:hypothetical protein
MTKHKQYLCTCKALGCADGQVWSDVHSQYTAGTWVTRTLYFRHRKLDNSLTVPSGVGGMEATIGISSTVFGSSSFDSGTSVGLTTDPEQEIPLMRTGIGLGHSQKDVDTTMALLRQQTSTLEATANDIHHIISLAYQRILSFSICGPLCFSCPPSRASLEFSPVQPFDDVTDLRSGPLSLLRSSAFNDAILTHEDRMLSAYLTLKDIELPEGLQARRNGALVHIRQELQRVNEIKIAEWNHQVRLVKGAVITDVSRDSDLVDTSKKCWV